MEKFGGKKNLTEQEVSVLEQAYAEKCERMEE